MCLLVGEVVGCFLNNPKALVRNQTNENKQIEVKLFVREFERIVCALSHIFRVDSIALPIHVALCISQHPIITPRMVRNYQLFLHSDELMSSTVVLSQEVNLLWAGFHSLKLVLSPKKLPTQHPPT